MHLMRLFIYFLKAGVKNIHCEIYKRWTNSLIMYSFRERRCDASYYEASFPELASPARTWRLCVFLAQTWIETSLNELLYLSIARSRMFVWKAYCPVAGAELLCFICRDQRKLKYRPPFVSTVVVVFSSSSWTCSESCYWWKRFWTVMFLKWPTCRRSTRRILTAAITELWPTGSGCWSRVCWPSSPLALSWVSSCFHQNSRTLAFLLTDDRNKAMLTQRQL